MGVRVYQLPSDLQTQVVAQGHGRARLESRAGVRHFCAYLTVRSERDDVDAVVQGLDPLAVPVNVEHL